MLFNKPIYKAYAKVKIYLQSFREREYAKYLGKIVYTNIVNIILYSI